MTIQATKIKTKIKHVYKVYLVDYNGKKIFIYLKLKLYKV